MLTSSLIIALVAIAILIIASGLNFNTSFIPGPLDDKLKPEGSITKTASYNGAAVNFGTGFSAGGPGQPMAAVLNISAIDRADTNETYAFKVQESADGSTWTDASPSVSRTTVGAFSIPYYQTAAQARVVLTAGGTTPSVTYETFFVPFQV